MAKIYTLEELKAWSPEKRKALYDNAKKTLKAHTLWP